MRIAKDSLASTHPQHFNVRFIILKYCLVETPHQRAQPTAIPYCIFRLSPFPIISDQMCPWCPFSMQQAHYTQPFPFSVTAGADTGFQTRLLINNKTSRGGGVLSAFGRFYERAGGGGGGGGAKKRNSDKRGGCNPQPPPPPPLYPPLHCWLSSLSNHPPTTLCICLYVLFIVNVYWSVCTLTIVLCSSFAVLYVTAQHMATLTLGLTP